MNAQVAPAETEDDVEVPTDLDLLQRAPTAPVYDVAHVTPLQRATRLSARLGNQVLLKREDQQPVFSFKLRGGDAVEIVLEGDSYSDAHTAAARIPEPAGALAVAGLKQYVAAHDLHDESLVAVVSGANMDFDRLRFIAERAELGDAREAIFAVTIPEERGSFRRFCTTLGRHAITGFNYRIGDTQQAHLFVGIRTHAASERALLAADFRAEGFAVMDLTGDELAKQHLRHMIGGRSPLARDGRLYRFEFPERPGALTDFLEHMHPHWNISLFHYRNQGADYGRIVVGIQVPRDERAAFQRFLATLGYPHADETANLAYRLLLCA